MRGVRRSGVVVAVEDVLTVLGTEAAPSQHLPPSLPITPPSRTDTDNSQRRPRPTRPTPPRPCNKNEPSASSSSAARRSSRFRSRAPHLSLANRRAWRRVRDRESQLDEEWDWERAHRAQWPRGPWHMLDRHLASREECRLVCRQRGCRLVSREECRRACRQGESCCLSSCGESCGGRRCVWDGLLPAAGQWVERGITLWSEARLGRRE